jgi:hypothetical protein
MADHDALGPHALDFWLRDWAVSWGDGGQGTNSIRPILEGRVIEESFGGRDKDDVLLGRSLSVLDERDGQWRQTWVDSNGSYLDFVGVEVDGRIAFERETTLEGAPVVQRMVWLDVTADGMRWQWQRSRDGRASWQVSWEIAYRRA